MIVKEMTRQECVALLSECRLGRLACARDNRPYVVPISYAFADNHLYGFSLVGQKIEWMRTNPLVCVQVDQFAQHREWQSVVIYGRYEELSEEGRWVSERFRAWSLLQAKQANWWEPGSLKPGLRTAAKAPPHLFYRIKIESMTGRQAIDSDGALPV